MNLSAEFHYRLPERIGGTRPGAHASAQVGAGQVFRRHVPFLAHPDPRRVDVRASLLDPHGGLRVRVAEQRGAVPVVAVADLSASMGYAGAVSKPAIMADFLSALARSAYRHGDACGFIGCGARITPAWVVPPTRNPALLEDLAQRLRGAALDGPSAWAELASWLPARRALVFLLSDFHLPDTVLLPLVAALARHRVVPVVLWDAVEAAPPARRGVRLQRDLESGALQLVWIGAGTARRWSAAYASRAARLRCLFGRYGWEPLYLGGGYDADTVTRYFYRYG